MLTTKELQYVNAWANKIPMPGYDYSIKILKEMKKCYEIYKNKYQGKEYNMIFSDSEEICFEIMSKNLCHMLGIDFNNIKGEYFDVYRYEAFGTHEPNFTSFDLVELILENMEKVAELDNDPNNSAKAINYYKSSIKCEIFNKLSAFDKFNFALINNGLDVEDGKEKRFLFVPSNEALTPYFMMGLVKDTMEDKYGVATLIAPPEPKGYFEGKEVSIPTQILISDNDQLSKIVATPEEKIQLLTMYANICNKYNMPNMINIYGDYENMLNELSKDKVYIK